MPTYLEVWEIFLAHEIQMAQIVGCKDGNAKNSSLAVTRVCSAEFLLSYKVAAFQMQNPLDAHASSFFFPPHLSPSPSGAPGASNLFLEAPEEICMLLAFKSS